MVELDAKYNDLLEVLRDYGSVVLGYSGGVDSTFLLCAATEALGRDNVLAVIARSDSYTQKEYKEAVEWAKAIDARVLTVETEEMFNNEYTSNPTNRCYYCKQELFTKLHGVAEREGVQTIIDGFNYDDLQDYRPGSQAAKELAVRSPLYEAKLTKAEIRELSHRMELPTWDMPAMACLSSRVPYGEEITPEKLHQIEQAEEVVRELGFRQLRVRHHGDIARIEVSPAEIPNFLNGTIREQIVAGLKEAGFKYVSLDLEGYRSGSMNEVLLQIQAPKES